MNRGKLLSVVLAGALMAMPLGCQNDDPFEGQGVWYEFRDYIPEGAQVVAEGKGKISYTAKEQGTAYLINLDETTKMKEVDVPKVLGAVVLLPGMVVELDGAKGTCTVGGAGRAPTQLKGTNASPTTRYQIKFKPGTDQK